MVEDQLFRTKMDTLLGKLDNVITGLKGPYEKEISIGPDAAASDTWEKPIFKAPFNCKITKVEVIPQAIIGQATNYMTLDVVNKSDDATGTTSLMAAARACNSTNTIAAFIGVDLVATDAEVEAGETIVLKKAVAADGQAFPGAYVQVTYEAV
jgi:hypothetical protein